MIVIPPIPFFRTIVRTIILQAHLIIYCHFNFSEFFSEYFDEHFSECFGRILYTHLRGFVRRLR